MMITPSLHDVWFEADITWVKINERLKGLNAIEHAGTLRRVHGNAPCSRRRQTSPIPPCRKGAFPALNHHGPTPAA